MEATKRAHVGVARRRLSAWFASPETPDILEGALLVAAEEYPQLDVDREVARIRSLAGLAGKHARTHENPFARNDAIASYFSGVVGLRGDHETYDDPRNCFLNEVLSRRRGIPLTLSLLYVEAAKEAGFESRTVALPGHFVVRLTDETRSFLVDPFHGGRVITEEDCRQLVSKSTGRPSLFRRDLLDGASSREILHRLLQNLKRIYLAREDYSRALSAVQRILLLQPGEPGEIRDRGLLLAHLGSPGAAAADLEAYLTLAPDAPDADSVRGRLAWLLRRRIPEPR